MARSITKFPHAEGLARRDFIWDEQVSYGMALDQAFREAVRRFVTKYNRQPDWENFNFRGTFSTVNVICEVWEE